MTEIREKASRQLGKQGGWCRFALAIFVLATVLATTTSLAQAQSQVTPKTLIGDAVRDTSAERYSDVAQAIKRFDNNDPRAAREFLETAKRKEAKLPPVDLMMAKLYFVKGQSAAGSKSLETTVRENPGEPEPFLLFADQSFNSNQMIQAMALYDKSIGLIEKYDVSPRRKRKLSIRARAGRAAVNQRWHNWAASEADLRVWIEADPEDGNAHNRLGLVLFMLHKEKEGYDAFVEAKKWKKEFPSPYVSAASMYHQLAVAEKEASKKKVFEDRARQAYERAYKEDKTDRTTLISYSDWLIKRSDTKTAEQILAAARRAHPNVYQVYLLSGVLAQMTNNRADAERFYNQTLVVSPGNRDANNQLALLLIDSDEATDKSRAEKIARINAVLNPKNADVNITLAWVLRQVGNGTEANQAYQKGLRLGALSPDSNLIVAKLLIEQNRAEVARGILDSALKNSEGIFVNRAEAKALLETLK